VFEARGVNGREDRDHTPRTPAAERVRYLHRERIVGGDGNDHDAEPTISAPSMDDQRSADRAELVQARRFFDRLLDVAMRDGAPQQADAEITAPTVD
jgi:hypothetical protein